MTKEQKDKQQADEVKCIINRAKYCTNEDADNWYTWLMQDLARYLLPGMDGYKAREQIGKMVSDARAASLGREPEEEEETGQALFV